MNEPLAPSVRFICLVFVAVLAACGADVTESPDAITPDSAPVAERPEAEAPKSTDATSRQTVDVEPSEDLVTPDGWGPLRIGMSRSEVAAAAGEDANPDAVGGPEPEQCDEFRPSDAPAGILVMIEKGVLTRVSVSRQSEIRTPEGFQIGDSGSDVIETYGPRALVEPHKYLESPAKYITIWREGSTESNRRGIRYEIDTNGKIAHIRVGGPSIAYVEGCL